MEKCNLDVDFEILNSVKTDSEALSKTLAANKVDKDKDLMYVKFRYVHEGSNSNNDVFIGEELEEKHTTAILKPINWQHKEQKIIGNIYDTEFISRADSDDGRAAVNVYGVIYKYLFPAVAEEIKTRYENEELAISMETWFETAECSVCGEKFESESKYCSHLRQRYSVASNKRILHEITFGGAGIVDVPADKDALALSVASQTEAQELKQKVAKRAEVMKFDTILSEASNLFYNIIYSYYSNKEEGVKERKARLNELMKDLKSLLDSINVNKIAKGELDVDNDNTQVSMTIVDALIEKAKAESKEEFKNSLDTEINSVKAEMQQEIDTLKKQVETLTAEKEKAEADLNDFKEETAKKDKLTARKQKLADNKIAIGKDQDEVIVGMSDEAFDLFVSASAKADEQEEENEDEEQDNNQANASALDINDNDDNKDDEVNPLDFIKQIK